VETARDAIALLLYTIPSFSIQSLRDQHERILAWIDRERLTHAIVVHPRATELIPELTARGIHVYVYCHDAAGDLARQMISVSRFGQPMIHAALNWRAIDRWEKRNFALADEVWVPSEIDVQRQRNVCSGGARLRCVPNAVNITDFQPDVMARTHDVVLPAYFGRKMSNYSPDAAGAKIMSEQTLPIVQRSIPDARLVLLGRDPDGVAKALERSPDVIATGEVSDTKPYLKRAGVVIVPILNGSGTRYKILEALALHLPVVSTPLGAEGLDVRDGEHLLIREIDEFPEAIVSILRDPEFGRRLGRAGRKLIEDRYSWDRVEAIIRDALFEKSAGAGQYQARASSGIALGIPGDS
jgi:glycosyltransferase involved in cell wall biosynthesis